MKIDRELINSIIERLASAYENIRERRQIAWWMLEALTQASRATLLAHQPHLTHQQEIQLNKWIEQQVKQHKPLQYILASVPFLDLSLKVEPPIAIPRPETEYWVDELIQLFEPLSKKELSILDLCSGSGCIALALAQAFPHSRVMGTDINEKAIALAQENMQRNKITNAEFIYSDLFTNLYEIQFDLIVSNPPYISSAEWQTVDKRVRNWEDERALRANEDGLAIIRIIIEQAPRFLKNQPLLKEYKLPQLVLEIGSTQGARVKELLTERGYHDISIMQDQYGNDRVVLARLT